MTRVTGSLAFVAAARAAFLVTKDKDNEARRLFLPMKNNLDDDRTGRAFTVQSAQVDSALSMINTSPVMWDAEPVAVMADEAMARSGDPEDCGALKGAKSLFQEVLKHDAVPSKQVRAQAEEAGDSWRTIRRAQNVLNIEVRKVSMNGLRQCWPPSKDQTRR
jgi:hypothetical protein